MQSLKINILRCMFFSWDYRPLIFSVRLQPLEISEMLGKNTHTAPSADRHGAQPDNSSKLKLPEERDGELMSRWMVFLQTLTPVVFVHPKTAKMSQRMMQRTPSQIYSCSGKL